MHPPHPQVCTPLHKWNKTPKVHKGSLLLMLGKNDLNLTKNPLKAIHILEILQQTKHPWFTDYLGNILPFFRIVFWQTHPGL